MWRAATWIVAVAAVNAIAQENAPPGFLRGDLISSQGVSSQGQLRFLVFPDHVYTCTYDERTYIERANQRVTMDSLAKGDHLEIVSDRQPGSSLCYARAIQVLSQTPVALTGVAPIQSWSLPFTLSGAVASITPDLLILRLRSGEHKMIRLRPETRYIQDGQSTDRTSLEANRVVFIRARKDLHGQAEASQVIWGDILRPQPSGTEENRNAKEP